LGKRPWSSNYTLDFRQLQTGGRLFSKQQEEFQDELKPEVVSTHESALMRKTPGSLVHSHGMEYLSQRSWRGLEQDLGQTVVEKVQQGRTGIPMGYQDEGQAVPSEKKTKLKVCKSQLKSVEAMACSETPLHLQAAQVQYYCQFN